LCGRPLAFPQRFVAPVRGAALLLRAQHCDSPPCQRQCAGRGPIAVASISRTRRDGEDGRARELNDGRRVARVLSLCFSLTVCVASLRDNEQASLQQQKTLASVPVFLLLLAGFGCSCVPRRASALVGPPLAQLLFATGCCRSWPRQHHDACGAPAAGRPAVSAALIRFLAGFAGVLWTRRVHWTPDLAGA
jgi:hypothetical protein